jgi:hypothetical protein
MSQPTFVQKIDGSSASAHSLTLTPGTATLAGDMLLVGVAMTAPSGTSPQQVAGIIDSAGTPVVGGVSTGVPVNTWSSLGVSNNAGVRTEWWISKGAVSVTWVEVLITGTGPIALQAIVACMLEYSGANGASTAVFQSLQANQNTISTQYILETVATTPNSPTGIMIGLFAMLGDTFNASPPSPSSAPETVRSTNSISLPPSLSSQVIEQDTLYSGTNNKSISIGGETLILAGGALNLTAESATQLATSNNVALSSMGCLYVVISGGLILNTQPGFNDQPDSSLAAGQYALGSQMAKINGNAALGMCRMEIFPGAYTNGETVALPISTVDGYQYQQNELTYIWAIQSSANSQGWLTGPTSLWYCNWEVDQDTGLVTSDEWYRNDDQSAASNDGTLMVWTIAQRQQQTLTTAVSPTWTQKDASSLVTDVAYSTDLLVAMNNNAKFAVIGQECIPCVNPSTGSNEYYNGETIPLTSLVSDADGYQYSYAEVSFVFSWRWTVQGNAISPGQPSWTGVEGLGNMYASVSSVGVVSLAIGWTLYGSDGNVNLNTDGRIAVFAFCRRARTGTPAAVAENFAEIPNTRFYPGNPIPAGLAGQILNNINEAALTPEFFGPTDYLPGATVPCPTSLIDGYVYKRSELTYIWEWHVMDTGVNDDPRTYPTTAHVRTPLFYCGSATSGALGGGGVNQSTGLVSTQVWHLPPGGPYETDTNTGIIRVTVVAVRTAQQTAVSGLGVTPPSDAGSAVVDQYPPGAITVNGT